MDFSSPCLGDGQGSRLQSCEGSSHRSHRMIAHAMQLRSEGIILFASSKERRVKGGNSPISAKCYFRVPRVFRETFHLGRIPRVHSSHSSADDAMEIVAFMAFASR